MPESGSHMNIAVLLRLLDGIHDKVEFRFARRRGGGTVNLSSGPTLIMVSLGIAARLKLELSDANGATLELLPKGPGANFRMTLKRAA